MPLFKNGEEKVKNDAPEIRLKTDKVYYIQCNDESWGAYKFVEKNGLGQDVFLQCIALEQGFEEGKTVYLPTHFIQKIVEFNSMAEYDDRYTRWEEEEKANRFKSP